MADTIGKNHGNYNITMKGDNAKAPKSTFKQWQIFIVLSYVPEISNIGWVLETKQRIITLYLSKQVNAAIPNYSKIGRAHV